MKMNLKVIAETRVSELMEQAKKLGFPVPRPTVVFKKRGKTAGTMNNLGVMDLNSKLMEQNLEDFVKNTIGHEFAHHICFVHYPNVDMVHGPEWKAIMVKLGLEPNRCHDYDVSSVKTRELNKFEYKCSCCGDSVILTSISHNRAVRGEKRYYHIGCKTGDLIYVRELGKISYTEAAQKVKH